MNDILEQGYVREVMYPEFYEAYKPEIGEYDTFEEALRSLLTEPKTRKTKNTPRGYYDWDDDTGAYHPCPELICGFLRILYEFRYKNSRSIRDSLEQASKILEETPKITYTISTVGGLSNLLLRFQQVLGLTETEYVRTRTRKYKEQRTEQLGKRRHSHAIKSRKKVAQRKRLTQTNEELRKLKQEELRLRRKAAQQARILRLSGDPTKMTEAYKSPTLVVYFLLSFIPDLMKPKKKKVPDIIIGENLIEKYNFMLANGYDDRECMRIYREIVDGGKKYDERDVAFLPTPRQYRFLAAPEDMVLYGGAAG